EFQVVGVIDDAPGIGVLVVDAYGKTMHLRHPPPRPELPPGGRIAALAAAPANLDSDSRRPTECVRAAYVGAVPPESDRARLLPRSRRAARTRRRPGSRRPRDRRRSCLQCSRESGGPWHRVRDCPLRDGRGPYQRCRRLLRPPPPP